MFRPLGNISSNFYEFYPNFKGKGEAFRDCQISSKRLCPSTHQKSEIPTRCFISITKKYMITKSLVLIIGAIARVQGWKEEIYYFPLDRARPSYGSGSLPLICWSQL